MTEEELQILISTNEMPVEQALTEVGEAVKQTFSGDEERLGQLGTKFLQNFSTWFEQHADE